MNYNIKDAQGILVDYRIDDEVKVFLNTLGREIFYTDKVDFVMDEVAGHPDIFACPVKNATVFEPRLFNLYKEKLKDYNIVLGNKNLAKSYPEDVAYNVAIVGEFAIGKLSSVDKNLLELIHTEGYRFINVNQGYSKCSITIVNETSIITADTSIALACERFMDVKLIAQEENILLGKFYGFIGGASFGLGEKLIFFGDYKTHKDYKAIEEFCESKGVVPISIGEGNLKDYGGIVPLYKY